MTPLDEFAPIGKKLTGIERLDIDFTQQRDLVFDIQHTGNELEYHPLVVPSYREIILARIAILDPESQKNDGDKMWLSYSETDKGLFNSTIDLQEKGTMTRLELSPFTGDWEVRHQGADSASERISNATVVRELEAKFKDKDILQPLLDSIDFSAIEIPRLLAGHLKKHTQHEVKTIYTTNDSLFQGIDFDVPDKLDAAYTSAVGTMLSVQQKNGQTQHTLAVQAPYPYGPTKVQKQYIYTANSNDRTDFIDAEGFVHISSADGLTQQMLDRLAKGDQIDSDPLYTLQNGLKRLRTKYDLDSESVA